MHCDYSDDQASEIEAARDRAQDLRHATEQRRQVEEAHQRDEGIQHELSGRRREAAETVRATAERDGAAAEGIRNDAMMSLRRRRNPCR